MYSEVVTKLLAGNHFQTLGPALGDAGTRPLLAELTVEKLNALPPADPSMAQCCLSGLWLYYDFLDESHTISQNIHTPEGSYWHAIMHRREGDFSNSKYWVRRVGDHPVYAQLANKAQSLGETSVAALAEKWDPYVWVDLCQEAIQGGRDLVEPCQRLQQAEWRLLFDYCHQRAWP